MHMTTEFDAPVTDTPRIVHLTKRLESDQRLDRAVRKLQPIANALLADRSRRNFLHGMWLGHGVHPLLTDLPLGAWTSVNLLDFMGGEQARPAARRLLTFGVLAALPTAVTGVAEWGVTETREKRVGVVHATSNTIALGLYTSSLFARRGGKHKAGVLLALGGGLVASVGGYLGGHLTEVRKVSSRHPAF
jgi:hypothetical protein